VSIWQEDVDKRIEFAQKLAANNNMIKPNNVMVFVTGWRSGSGFTNTIRVVPYCPSKPELASDEGEVFITVN